MSGWLLSRSMRACRCARSWLRAWARYAAVAALMLSGYVGAQEAAPWRGLIHAEHVPAVDQGNARATAVLEQLSPGDYGFAERDQVAALLDAQSIVRPPGRLLADWRCRSIQVNRYGIFSYRPFRCRIRQVEGEWDFSKLSGSQRRSGSLYADGPGKWIFLGGSHVNDDPPRHYSGLADATQSQESDSVGILQTLADGRLRMLLDADSESFELYVLER